MNHRLLTVTLAAASVASLSLALYYGARSASYRERWAQADAALQQRERLKQPPAPAPTPDLAKESDAAPISAAVAPDEEGFKAQIRDLQQSLQEKDALIVSLREAIATTNRPPRPERAWRDPNAWLEELKKDDPARYEQMVQEREEARQRVQSSFAEKAAHFINRDTSHMAEEEQKQYQFMLQLLDQTWRLSEQMRVDLPRDQRREIAHALRDNMNTLEPLLTDERQREFYALGRQLGYSGNDATQFVQYVNQIIEVTSLQNIFRSMRPGGFGAGGGPEGAPRRP